MIHVTAPGKLVLLGEYAVLDGAPSIVAAVDRGVSCEASASPTLTIETPGGDDRFVRAAIEACLTGETGKPLIRARTVASTRRSLKLGGAPTTPELPSPQSSEPFEFDFFSQDTGYHRAMELRLARGAETQRTRAMR